MRDITHFLLATLLSLATLACRHVKKIMIMGKR